MSPDHGDKPARVGSDVTSAAAPATPGDSTVPGATAAPATPGDSKVPGATAAPATPGDSTVRVGIDVTALVGPPGGIHQTTRALVRALKEIDGIDVRGWLLTLRGARPETAVPVRRSRFPRSSRPSSVATQSHGSGPIDRRIR